MKQTTIRLDSETLSKIEWIKIYMTEHLPFKTKWTTTDVIKLSIDYRYSTIKELSNK